MALGSASSAAAAAHRNIGVISRIGMARRRSAAHVAGGGAHRRSVGSIAASASASAA